MSWTIIKIQNDKWIIIKKIWNEGLFSHFLNKQLLIVFYYGPVK